MNKETQEVPVDVEDVYQLSPIQQGLLYEQHNHAKDGVYIEQLTLTFEGNLDAELLGNCWQQVVDRHPILRTEFHWQRSGQPMQVVRARAELNTPVHDWRALSEPSQRERLARFLAHDRASGFALDIAPLMRTDLVRVGERRWHLLWRFSHLLMDGWSFGLAVREFIDRYRAGATGTMLRLPAPAAYREYVAWWRRRDAVREQAYWAEQICGYQPPAPLRLDPDELADGEFPQAWVEVELGEVADQVRTMARQERITVNTVVHGAWMLLLGRYLRSTDVICGATAAHRPVDLTGAETTLGPMVVTLPIRHRADPGQVAAGWLRGLHAAQARARDHVALPLPDIQRLIGVPLGSPMLDSSVSFENVPMPDLSLTGTGVTIVDIAYDGRPHFPLTLVILPGERMPLRIVVDRRRVGHAAAARLAEQLRSLTAQLARRPEWVLGELTTLSESERDEVVNSWMPTKSVDPLPGTLHECFRTQATRRPDATAVVYGKTRVSYGELDRASEMLASQLRATGVQPGDLVGLCLTRSHHFVEAMLAVLKCGAAYIPLDPDLPDQRIRWLCQDSAACVVIAERFTAPLLAASEATLVVLEELPTNSVPSGEVTHVADSESLAYVLYTSGSTGRPKGVRVSHGNVLGLIAAGRDQFGFTETDVFTCCHSYAFDYSVWEIWGALANGGSCVMVPHWDTRSPKAIRELVRDQRVTVLSQTPAAFEEFDRVDAEAVTPLPALRMVCLGGDRLGFGVLRDWLARHGDARPTVVNLYGLTETSVVATWHRITRNQLRNPASLIGQPLPNLRVYLLDELRQPVSPGLPGELWVAGSAVAHGYHGRPELTAQRFADDPFRAGERMYRTGDLGRTTSGGQLEFLGRIDQQVKVRGFRLEPAEVEAALRELEPIRTSAVTLRPSPTGPQLVGYLVAAEEPVPMDEIYPALRRQLPAYAIPSRLSWVPSLPRTSSGKVDYQALPSIEHRTSACTTAEHATVAPRGADELRLHAMITEMLKPGVAENGSAQPIGVTDELTEWGMHSLHAMRIVRQVHAELGVEIQLRELVKDFTIAALAALVVEARSQA